MVATIEKGESGDGMRSSNVLAKTAEGSSHVGFVRCASDDNSLNPGKLCVRDSNPT
jgi:hypothetical protein